MAGGRGKRVVPVNKEKAKEIKSLLMDCKNNVEHQRVNIMVVYLGGLDIEKTALTLSVSITTVQQTVAKYVNDNATFYKTNYKGKIETKERKELKAEIKSLVDEKINKEENIDINETLRQINKKHGSEVLTYSAMWFILRKQGKYNYQKPFVTNKKQPEHAEKIIKGRLTKAIIEVGISEKNIDAVAIKNKKTKFGESFG